MVRVVRVALALAGGGSAAASSTYSGETTGRAAAILAVSKAKALARAGERERATKGLPSAARTPGLSSQMEQLSRVSQLEHDDGELALTNPDVISVVEEEKSLGGDRFEVTTRETVRFDFDASSLKAGDRTLDPTVDFTAETYKRRSIVERSTGVWRGILSDRGFSRPGD